MAKPVETHSKTFDQIKEKLKHLLFVTCMPLEPPRSASMAFMDILLDKYLDLFAWYALQPPKPGVRNPYPIPYAYSEALSQPTRFPVVRQFMKLFPWAHQQGHKAAAFGKAQNVQVVWADLAFEAVVAGRVAAEQLGVPLVVSVHDDPVNRIRVKNLPGWLMSLYEREFARTLRTARRVGVISDYMGEAYRQRYGVETITLYPGVVAHECLPVRTFDPYKLPIVIGSIGSVNSAANWNLLLEAVRLLNQRHGIGKFRILHIGAPPEDLPLSADVEITGWLPEADFAEQLVRMDLGFLNWDFAPEMAETGHTSFPLKIHSYIQAQVPMLALGPADSTVVRFVRDYQCGEICIQPDAKELAAHLQEFLESETKKGQAKEGVSRLKQIFSRETFFETFNSFVHLPIQDQP